MLIDDLSSRTSLSDTDEIPVEVGRTLYKTTYAKLLTGANNNANIKIEPTSIAITPSFGTNNIASYYCKVGSRVHLKIALKDLTTNTVGTVTTLPAGYRPMDTVMALVASSSSGPVITFSGSLYIFSNGYVKIKSADSTAFAYVEYDARQ